MTALSRFHFHDFHPQPGDIQADVLNGLHKEQKTIAPKYFYDANGSKLFDRICRLPEYYLTRTEISLLRTYGAEIEACVGKEVILFELGSGSSIKIRLLLDAIQPASYVPMDISRQHLLDSSTTLAQDYSWLDIHAVCIDYAEPWELPKILTGSRRIAFFPGSSIGNLDEYDALALLKRVAELVGDEGGLLIGVDLTKDVSMLEAAYNDQQNVTAAFNRNVLVRLNREMKANFRLDRFEHRAFYNRRKSRIEMHLMSECEQSIQIADRCFYFNQGETIHTENSYKYSLSGFRQLARLAGFNAIKVWVDQDNLFSIHYLETL